MKTETRARRRGAAQRPAVNQTFHDVFLEALSYLNDGSWATLQAAFDAVDEALTADGTTALETARILSVLAHIDIQLDRRTMRPIAWSTPLPTLTPLADGDWLLSGRRSTRLLRAIAHPLERRGERVQIEAIAGQPSRVTLRAERDQLEEIAAAADRAGETLRVSTLGPLELAQRLPALSTVLASLPRGAAAGGGVQRLELDTSRQRLRWEPSDGISGAGVFRIDPPPLTYVFVERHGATPVRVNARLARMLALLQSGLPVLARDPATGATTANHYAEPPTLYERALVMCSGIAPSTSLHDRLTSYDGVPHDVASAIHSRLADWSDDRRD